MTTYISNAFSLSMVPDGATVRTRTVDLPSIAHKLGKVVSVVGHEDTATVFSALLGIPIGHDRVTISLTHTDTLYVGQLIGGRLPEGAKTLPDNYKIKWICVQIDAEPRQLERWWTKGGESIYGALDRVAEDVASKFTGGKVTLMQDAWGNPHWDIEAP